jgi:peptidoglycan-associated lipoprotein
MLIRTLPALCAVLLLAACGTADQSQPSATQANAAPSSGTGTTGIDSNGLGTGPAAAGGAAAFKVQVGDTVRFDTDSSGLSTEAQAVLQKQAKWLQQNRQQTATIEGHADERGTREYNLALGERRAPAVVSYLTALGIDPSRLKDVSYGKERPVCPGATETCWSQNRRGVTALDQP